MRSNYLKLFSFLYLFCLSTYSANAQLKHFTKTDICIYGATSGGIMSAIQTSRLGQKVLLIEPTEHIGGITTGGLQWTDFGKENAVGGLSAEFYKRITDYYKTDAAWKVNDSFKNKLLNSNTKFIKSFEPRIADSVFRKMLNEAGITVITGKRLNRKDGIKKEGNVIKNISFESGEKVSAKIFIDATYEGDLMALAGVTYTFGRESKDAYNEDLAGVMRTDNLPSFIPKSYFNKVDYYIAGADTMPYSYVSPYDSNGKLLYGIQDVSLEKPGTGDKKIQAYGVRVVLTTDPNNRINITRPSDYDSTKYELLIRYINAHKLRNIRQIFFKIDPVPNLKTDFNDGCPFSTDHIGFNWDYPDASYERREEILKDHHSFTKGLLYFAGHDSRVPPEIRNEVLRYGYPKDEYVDNNNWTTEVYIRESRRMVGEYVMTQKDIQQNTTKAHSIGLGSYTLDSHHVQRLVDKDGNLINEGNLKGKVDAYEIPLEALIPKENECSNLLVTFCLASSHVAYGSIRMEPVFMVLSQSAATIACMALGHKTLIHNVDYELIKKELIRDKQEFKIKK
ncbi:MAG: FAD-dependent oxidoreductase [Ginsengibacter sp.]